MKVTLTVLIALNDVTVHVFPTVESHPVQTVELPVNGVAVNVICCPDPNEYDALVHDVVPVPQLIPDGLEVTFPDPVPNLLTVN